MGQIPNPGGVQVSTSSITAWCSPSLGQGSAQTQTSHGAVGALPKGTAASHPNKLGRITPLVGCSPKAGFSWGMVNGAGEIVQPQNTRGKPTYVPVHVPSCKVPPACLQAFPLTCRPEALTVCST